MKNFLSRLVAIGFLAAIAAVPMAQAQVAQQVTQSAQHLDAATFMQAPAGGATACATVNSTVANNTVTITPSGGQFVYITGIYIDIVSDTTGTTGVATMSTTNLTGGPVWSLATLAAAAGGQASYRQIAEHFTTPLKSRTAGTAVTFVPSAQIANEIVCTRVAGYFGS